MGKDEVVVITGASAGLGRAIAREFAKKGARIGLLARGVEGLEAAKNEVEELGGQAVICLTDVADPMQIERAADLVEETFGPIDIWVNNAMASVFSPINQMQPEDYLRVTEVTYLGQVYGALSALKRMRIRNKGKLIFIGSALSYRGIPLQSAYCGAKHAVAGFYDSLVSELIHEKSAIKTSIIHLPAMNTPQFKLVKNRLPHKPKPMGKIFQPEVAARAVIYAAEHNRREIRIGSPTVETILGNKLIPRFMDWWLARNGYKGQQTSEEENSLKKNNIWLPVPGDHGAHGSFDESAHEKSYQAWITLHRPAVRIALLTSLLTGLALFGLKQQNILKIRLDILKDN